MWFSVVSTLIDNAMRHHSGQNVVGSHESIANVSFITVGEYQRQRKCFVFSELDQERDTLKRAALSGLLSTMTN